LVNGPWRRVSGAPGCADEHEIVLQASAVNRYRGTPPAAVHLPVRMERSLWTGCMRPAVVEQEALLHGV
jgi:hypothetical protein